jgi:hypothetical protein
MDTGSTPVSSTIFLISVLFKFNDFDGPRVLEVRRFGVPKVSPNSRTVSASFVDDLLMVAHKMMCRTKGEEPD